MAASTGIIEVHSFQTATLTTPQFLTGAPMGIPERITGLLFRPLQGERRLPAVVLLHGVSRIEGNALRWTHTLNDLGIAAFLIDSFTGHGIPARHPPDYADGRTMIVDAYRSLAYLAQYPPIDPTRIAVMGFSRGGGAALYASLQRFQRPHAPAGWSLPPIWPSIHRVGSPSARRRPSVIGPFGSDTAWQTIGRPSVPAKSMWPG